MTTIINADNGIVSGISGLTQTGDASGVLALQSSGNTIATFGSNLNVAVVGNVSAANIVVTTGITYSNGAAYSSGGGLTMAAVQTANITAVASTIYPVNTTSANITATLPASPAAGAQIQFFDYAGTFGSKNFTINRNSSNIGGTASNVTVTTIGASVGLIYVDITKGWIPYNGFSASPISTYSIEALIIAGGGGGGSDVGGGGGAGGLLNVTGVVVSPGTNYSVTVGAAGAGATTSNGTAGATGSNTSGLGYTSLGGGGGGSWPATVALSGGSGGGGGAGGGGGPATGGVGGSGTNGQGYAGGQGGGGSSYDGYGLGGGGGGAGGVGGSNNSAYGGPGMAFSAWATATTTGVGGYYAGGGGGNSNSNTYAGAGGSGGGGNGNANAGVNTGGGGGGGGSPNNGGNGGSGIVIIRYISGFQRGTGGVVTSGAGYYYHTFLSSGTFIA
jgi:hypothetical protein